MKKLRRISKATLSLLLCCVMLSCAAFVAGTGNPFTQAPPVGAQFRPGAFSVYMPKTRVAMAK